MTFSSWEVLICLSFSFVSDQASLLSRGSQVQILGEVNVGDSSDPVVLAHIVRSFDNVDPNK